MDPTDHSFKHIHTPKSGLAACQCYLTDIAHKPVRNMSLFSPFDRWKNYYHSVRLSDLCKVTKLGVAGPGFKTRSDSTSALHASFPWTEVERGVFCASEARNLRDGFCQQGRIYPTRGG